MTVVSIEDKKSKKVKKTAKNRIVLLEMLELTEFKVARKFMQLESNEGNWIYNQTRKKWMYWSQMRHIWVEDNETHFYRKVKEFVENLSMEYMNMLEYEDREWAQVERFLLKCQTDKGVKGIMNCCKAESKIIEETDLDKNPYLINFSNGIYDLKDNKFISAETGYTRGFLLTQKCDVKYVEGSTCKLWEKTIDEIFLHDKEYIDYVQRILGYALFGKDKEHAIFILHGEKGRNGKTTITDVLKLIFGSYAKQVPTTAFTKQGKDQNLILAELYGKRLALISETEKRDELAIALLKNISGGNTISGRRLYQGTIEYKPTFKVFIETNHLPTLEEDNATWERIHAINFPRYFEPHERDTDLGEKLKKELSGILLWLLEGWKKYQEQRLTKPLKAVEDTQAYRDESDYLKMFLNDCFNLTADENDYVMGEDFFNAYCDWADQNRISQKERLNGIQFGKEIKKRKGIVFKSKRIVVDGKQLVRKAYVGMEYIPPKERG